MHETDDLGSLAGDLRALASAPAELLVRGTVVDEQYAIERVIGSGAMGVVYLATDLRLERNVAIKLARERSPIALARASREAVSLARLSHPNVVVVHQVGALDGRVYVAMEYVAGATARAWCETRSAREILTLYAAVGDGLAAAHAAGLVHRDFKPDNVLVGDDGRGRVADFGLATSESVTPDVAGTPAYMAPEQLRGEELDARADQFAFCAALLEALGPRRFSRHVEIALRRGMAPTREARWPALPPLLAELRRDPTRPRKVVALGAAPVLAAVAVFTATRGGPPPTVDRCAGGPPRMAAQWSRAEADKVHAAIAPAGSPAWVTAVADAAVLATDGWTARWSAGYRDVCEAGWTSALHDRGMECLARDEHTLRATLESLAEPGGDPAKLDGLVGRLPRPEACADPLYLAAEVPPPTEPVLARRVAETQDELARAMVLAAACKLERADELLRTIEARPAGEYAPLVAQIQFHRAWISRWRDDNEHALPLLEDTYYKARTVGDRTLAADAAAEATLALIDLSRDADAEPWGRLAEVEIATLTDPQTRSRILRALSVLATTRGDPARGLDLADRALEFNRPLADLHGLEATLQERAQAYDGLGKSELALADLDEAAAVLTRAYGEHPEIALIEDQRSLLLLKLGRIPAAVAAARHGLAVAEVTSGGDAAMVNHAVGGLGVALSHAREYPEALAMIDRSLAMTSKLEGAHSYNVASDLNNRCDLLARMDREAEAADNCTEAIAIWTDVTGKDRAEIASAELNLAQARIDLRQFPAAIIASERALAIAGKQPDGPGAPLALIARATARLGLGKRSEGRGDLEKAIALLDASPASNPAWVAGARLQLANVELHEGHVVAGRTLATAARDAFEAIGDERLDAAQKLIAQLEATR